MKAKTYVFECQEHKEYGSNGWKLAGNPNADPLGGLAVAHDILEHEPDGDMGVEDELRALGASIYVREYTRNMHSLGSNAGSDLPDVLGHVFHENMPLRDPGPTRAIDRETEIDDAIQSLTAEAAYQDELRERLTPELLRYIRGWFRIGYRAAQKRWRGVRTRELFDEIEERADYLLKHAEPGFTRLYVRLKFDRGIICDDRRVSVKIWTTEEYGE